jgi:hypothetical protein
LQEVPVLLQFRPVDLGPRLDQALLRLRQAAPEALDGIDGEHGGMFLVVRVKMRSMMLPAGFNEHPDDNSEETGEFWHERTVHRPALVGLTFRMSRGARASVSRRRLHSDVMRSRRIPIATWAGFERAFARPTTPTMIASLRTSDEHTNSIDFAPARDADGPPMTGSLVQSGAVAARRRTVVEQCRRGVRSWHD